MNTEMKTKKNQNGKIIEKRIILNSERGKISMDQINNLYKEIITRHDKKKIQITGMAIDNFKTIKSMDFIEDDLKYAMESYYKSFGVNANEVKDKFNYFFNVEIILFY